MTNGGMNTKLHAVTDTSSRPVRLFITAGQGSGYTGAAALMNGLPEAEWLLADRGYDADWFRETLIERAQSPAFLDASRARRPSSTTSASTKRATLSKECLTGSKIGGASQLATTDYQPSSSPSSHLLQPLFSGYKS